MLINLIQGMAAITGRLMLVTIFLVSALGNKIPNFYTVAGLMKTKGVPYPEIALGLAIGFLILGSIAILLGYMARWGAFLLFSFIVLATYYFHDFWNMPSTHPMFEQQLIHAMKNLSTGGGMLCIMANGTGAWSLGAKSKSAKSTVKK